ncbi:MAG TPA: phosphate signaling complex protein PhoU [Candidatus Limivivens intestinipullorum]|uniref:Phosphate-specific transport system accessory protein PhoU n=1 Tax=Candidatus Limivivens intestinipullorum TaxID=2840858 RepID=A0A9D1EQU7_9FIRM|nr:phosphate signaling complex protein PhoU [Candidatus Limivivens intestinipullorum]
MTTRKVYAEELNELALEVSKMGGQLEHMIDEVSEALKNMDSKLAEKIMKEDDIVDDMERKIEKACIRIVAKQQPVATDLRRVTSVMRLISDIERVADHCSDISEYILEINEDTPVKAPEMLFTMLEDVKKMAVDTIDSFVEEDLEKSKRVAGSDDKIDNYFLQIKDNLCKSMHEDIEHIKTYVDYLMITKYVERMADHCTNIAEWVSFIITGDLDQYMNS